MKLSPFLFFLTIALFSVSAGGQTNQAHGRLAVSPKAQPLPVSFDRRPAVNKAAVRSIEAEAFELLNSIRAEKGVARVTWSEDVAEIARLHSRNMADHRFFSHTGIDGSMIDTRAGKAGLEGWQAIGENIAYLRGYANPAEFAVEQWLKSAAHRNNLLSTKWNESAIGVAVASDGTYYFTQVFLRRK